MTPNQARKPENYGKVYWNLYSDLRAERSDGGVRKSPLSDGLAFKLGDTVTPNWTEEVFVISEIRPTDPITYKIKDLNGEEIEGTFYREELQETDQTIFRIEKVIRKTKDKALVKWKGYPDAFNSWVSLKDL